MRETFAKLSGDHRSEKFNRRLLTSSVSLVEAIGHRMAYEAAVVAGIDPLILRLYEVGAVLRDMAWYSENGLTDKQNTLNLEEETLTSLFPNLEQLLEHSGAKPYAFAAITSDVSWEKFVATLPVYRGDAYIDTLNPVGVGAPVKAHL